MTAFLKYIGKWPPLTLFAALLLVSLPLMEKAFSAELPGVPRVVSVSGVLTEIVYALAAEQRLVAVDSTSTYPPAAQQLAQVGYQRALSAEGVLAQQPTLILGSSDAGPPAVIQQLQSSGVAVTIIPHVYSAEGARHMLRSVAEALQLNAEGAALEQRFIEEWATTQQQIQRYTSRPRVLFVLSHAGGNLQVAGSHTAANAMIELAGAVNAMQGIDGYKPLTAEAVIAAAPEVILLTREGLRSAGGAAALWKNPGLALTQAGQSKQLVILDNLYLLGFGPRLPLAVRELAAALRVSGQPSR